MLVKNTGLIQRLYLQYSIWIKFIENVDEYETDTRNYWYVLIELRKKVVNIAIYMETLEWVADDFKLIQMPDLPDTDHDKKLAKKIS